ncbi:ABC transporter permease [Streptacidiphilus anmyonensis]|uniref:ABC transporter permease n=1 Tax=Streptacidiphilus anmyonensis TaxID=405782 RepID=UPI0005A813A2|nr:ABC transporter permease [Streptacidiphilus anmyonensis]
MGGFAGFVLLRLRAHRLLVAGALVSILVTTTVLAALAGFTSGVADAGVRRQLNGADVAATPLLLTRHAGYPDRAVSDKEARRLAATVLPGLPLEIRTLAVSDGFALPGGPPGDPDVTSLATLDRTRLRLLQGSWPTDAAPGGVVPIAVPEAAAQRLLQGRGGSPVGAGGSPVGERLTLTDQISKAPVTVLVAGVYRAANPADPYWQLDSLGGRGIQRAGTGTAGSGGGSVGGTSYGPMLTTDAAFASGAVPQSQLSWQAVPDTDQLHAADLGALAAADRAATARINQQGVYQAVGNLPTVLDQLRLSILVARSTLLVVVLQLVLLTAMTLLLTARLLSEEREGENALLRARGAAPGRIVRLATMEALLLAVPAAVLAPLLARPLIQLLAAFGPLSAAGIRLDGPLPASGWWTALATALGCAVVVVAPTVLRARGAGESEPKRGRRAALPSVLRGGADLALVALAIAAYLQLRHYAGTGTLDTTGGATGTTAGGTAGVDPVLVAAPALALAAGTALTLRLLPLVARIGERLATRGRSLPVALAAWQLSRRAHRSAGPVLALALAAAIGTLAIGQNASWEGSQRDQAAFDTGGDIRVASIDVPALGQGGMLAALPGVAAAVPVNRQQISIAGGGIGELLAYDTRAEAGRLPLRADLADRSAARLLGGLADPAPQPAGLGVPLPGRPAELDLSAQLTVSGLAADQTLSEQQVPVTVQVMDRFGLAYSLDSRSVAVDGRPHRLEFDLRAAAGSGTPGYPLTVSRIDLGQPVALARRDATGQPHPRLTAAFSLSADGAAASAPSGFGWNARTGDSSGGRSGPPYQPGRTDFARPAGTTALTAQLELGTFWDQSSGGPFDTPQTPDVDTSFTSARSAPTTPLAAVADQRFLDSDHAHLGSVLTVGDAGGGLRVRITGVVTQLPGTGAAAEQGLNGQTQAGGGTVLVDLPSYIRRLNGPDTANASASAPPVEWWLATSAGGRARADAALAADGDVAVFYDRVAVASAAAHDPIGSGPQSALLAGMVLAVVLASVGFAANASGAVRARATEFAVLRALGMSRRRMARATAAELALPIVLGVGVGLLLGEVITRLVVPLLVLTPQAGVPVPAVLVEIPVLPLAGLLAAVAAVPLLCAALLGFRGGDPARRLRTPEES